MLTIGSAFGDEDQALFDVGDVRRLGDGRIAVVNSGTRQLRVYGPSGRHLLDVGREGDGPGEFRRPRLLWTTPADSLTVFDGRTQRLTLLDPDFVFARSIQISAHDDARQAFVLHAFPDGRLLVMGLVSSGVTPRPGRFPGGISVFSIYSESGEYVGPIGAGERGENWGFLVEGGAGYTSMPFSNTYPASAASEDRVFLAFGAAPEVELRTLGGDLVRVLRWNEEPTRVDADLREAFVDWQMRRSLDAESRRYSSLMLADLEYPESLPFVASLLVDREGYLWVERFEAPWEDETTWWVFDQDGVWLGAAPVPVGLDIRDVGADYMLGVIRDDANVESVVMYSLDRNGS